MARTRNMTSTPSFAATHRSSNSSVSVHDDEDLSGMATPLVEPSPAETWDIAFDKNASIGLETCANTELSTRLQRVQPGSQAETLGVGQHLLNGPVFIWAVNGKPVYHIDAILDAVEQSRHEDFLGQTLVFTFGREPLRPPPVCKPCWACTKLLVHCFPAPDRHILTCSRNAKFLGICRPAQDVKRCSCYFFNTKIRLETVVCLLAWLLLLKSLTVLVIFTSLLQPFDILFAGIVFQMVLLILDGGLALYLLRGMVTRRHWALERFSLMMFLLTQGYVLVWLVQVVAAVAYDPWGWFPQDLSGVLFFVSIVLLEPALKFYLIWTAWSLAKEYKKKGRHGDNHTSSLLNDTHGGQRVLSLRLDGETDVETGQDNISSPQDTETEESDEDSL